MTLGIPEDVLAGYRPLAGAEDEMLDAHGRVRDRWSALAHALDDLGIEDLRARRAEVARLLDQDGVSYNGPGGQAGGSNPGRWHLDPVPLLLDAAEWAELEAGVVQRSELLDLVLADLYGERSLITRRLLPPEVVLGHPGFLRECDGIRLPSSRQLFSAAFDIVRGPEGRAWVVGDRTQAPSGAGYAIENRLVTSGVFPGVYRESQVHRLAPYIRTLRTALHSVAPPGNDEPHIVVLSPGPWSETSFEHAFLAARLGCPLVEGTDLLVRDGRVWLRSLSRLEPVDVILRRVDAAFSDPLELNGQSRLGVAGLLEACRRGTVSVVNTLGSGVLEGPGLLPFLPRLAEQLLGEPLRLPSAPAWWCGDDLERSHVLTHLDTMLVRSVSGWPVGVVDGALCSQTELDDLAAQISTNPHDWVGQIHPEASGVPTLTEHGLEARRGILRAFTVTRGESYAAMPGGLLRVVSSADAPLSSLRSGSVSKDVWILASEPEKLTSFWLSRGPATEAVEADRSLSARAAENLFWLGRYAERSESLVRLMRAVHGRRTEFQRGNNPAGRECLEVLLRALTSVTGTQGGFIGAEREALLSAPAPELLSLVADEDRPGTLAYDIRRMLDAAHAVRDQLSGDTWLVVGNLERRLVNLRRPLADQQAVLDGALRRVLTSLLALSGLESDSMVRDSGWRFMDLGRRLERAVQLAQLLRATITVDRGTAAESLLLESVLIAAESIITYRRRYRSQAQVETLLDLCLHDAGNPRSMRFQLERVAEDLAALPSAEPDRLADDERLVLAVSTTVRIADTARLARGDADGTRSDLDAFLESVVDGLTHASDAIESMHFLPVVPQHSFSTPPSVGRDLHVDLG